MTSDADAEPLADTGREAGVGEESLRIRRRMAETVLAGVVEDRSALFAECAGCAVAFAVGPSKWRDALRSERIPSVRSEHPGEVDAGIRVCDVPRVPGVGRAGANELLDQHKVKT